MNTVRVCNYAQRSKRWLRLSGSICRFHSVVLMLIALSCALFPARAFSQQIGPPAIVVSGNYFAYIGSSYTDPSGSNYSWDTYEGPAGLVFIDNNFAAHESSGGYIDFSNPIGYNATTYEFASVAWQAIGSDGYTHLGKSPAIIVLTSQGGGDFWNGSEFVTIYDGQTYFQTGSSPWYWFDGNADLVLDATNGWPASNVFRNPPQTIYINNKSYSISTITSSASGVNNNSYTDSIAYVDSSGVTAGIDRSAANGATVSADIWGYVNGQLFTGVFDTNTWAVTGVPDYIDVSFSAPSGYPMHGPPFISWDGNLLSFYYTTEDGRDLYWFHDSGDSGDNTVLIAADNSVAISNALGIHYGIYQPDSNQFNLGPDSGAVDLLALDANGNPLGLPSGITLLFGSGAPGHSMLSGTGTAYGPSHSYRRPDGSWGLKYLPPSNGVYLVQDENGNYTAPPYKFVSGSGDTVVNAIGGWPATNIYPQQIYINGIPCTRVAGSQYDSGAGLPRSGGVSYRASAYDLTVVLSWAWDTQFHGYVTGKYGQSSSFKGLWDGLSNFSGLTDGAIVSVTAPTLAPTNGNPPQVTVNGSALGYDSLASTALANAGTPGDVYKGSLGQSLTIYQNGTVSFILGSGIAPITGSYNASTHQFNFGAGNTVSLGNGNSAVVTATDTNGHNLATLNGNTNSGGVTELFGGLDVRGNTFSLGSWTSGAGENLYAFGLAYADSSSGSSLLSISTTRSAVDWQWTHPTIDGGSQQITAMLLDYAHRVLLYDPANPSNANVVLDPGGASGFHGPVRVQPQGDISMGGFQSGPTPP